MNETASKISAFTDLEVWQKAHQLVLLIYKITKEFPKDEMFGLVSQMRRAAVSITSNIAEGFSRFSYKEKVQFYAISLSSLSELQSQLLIARDIPYLPQEKFEAAYNLSFDVQRMLRRLITTSRSHYS